MCIHNPINHTNGNKSFFFKRKVILTEEFCAELGTLIVLWPPFAKEFKTAPIT
jgi:hypothetical protein